MLLTDCLPTGIAITVRHSRKRSSPTQASRTRGLMKEKNLQSKKKYFRWQTAKGPNGCSSHFRIGVCIFIISLYHCVLMYIIWNNILRRLFIFFSIFGYYTCTYIVFMLFIHKIFDLFVLKTLNNQLKKTRFHKKANK